MKNKNKTKQIIFLVIFFFLFSFLFVSISYASNPIVVGSEDTSLGSKYSTGNYELNDLIRVGLRVAQIIFGVIGSLALLMFVYGGVMMLISAGNSEKVSKAKGILTAAVIGLVIVFASYLIVDFTLKALGYTNSWSSLPSTSTPATNQTAP